MAFYTETLKEYLDSGNPLPDSFSLLEQTGYKFDELFFMRFADREIGFETEALFALKLTALADSIIPDYVKLLKGYDSALEAIKATKTGATTTNSPSPAIRKEWDLPIDSSNVEAIAPTKVEMNYPSGGDVNTNQDQTSDELQRKIDWFLTAKNTLIQSLLKSFEPLFMQVF